MHLSTGIKDLERHKKARKKWNELLKLVPAMISEDDREEQSAKWDMTTMKTSPATAK